MPLLVANNSIDLDPAIVFDASKIIHVSWCWQCSNGCTYYLWNVGCTRRIHSSIDVVAQGYTSRIWEHFPYCVYQPCIPTLWIGMKNSSSSSVIFFLPEYMNTAIVRCWSDAVSLVDKSDALDTTPYGIPLAKDAWSSWNPQYTLLVVCCSGPIRDITL